MEIALKQLWPYSYEYSPEREQEVRKHLGRRLAASKFKRELVANACRLLWGHEGLNPAATQEDVETRYVPRTLVFGRGANPHSAGPFRYSVGGGRRNIRKGTTA